MKHNRILITGTDTDVGKTVVSAILTLGLKAFFWKPISSGQSDTEWIKKVTELEEKHFFPETYRFVNHLSPHAAAALEKQEIDLDKITIPALDLTQKLIVEGAGGLNVPLNDRHLMVDLIKKMDFPVIVVARSQLGTINHTLLTLEKLRSFHIPILGVIMNGPKNPSNKAAIEKYGQIDVLGEVEPLESINPGTLLQAFKQIQPL